MFADGGAARMSLKVEHLPRAGLWILDLPNGHAGYSKRCDGQLAIASAGNVAVTNGCFTLAINKAGRDGPSILARRSFGA